jgi:putative Holliday junction resolvase
VKYLSIDYGTKRVGTAVSNPNGTIAFPRAVFANNVNLLSQLGQMVKEERIEHVIVGDTRSHGGGSNPITAEAEIFMETLARETGLPVSRVFEVFSSVEASRYAPKGSEHDDAAAAAVILQRFLDMNSSRAERQ